MSAQPEALRLADELERDKWHVPAVVMQAAADELRRLHAENASLAAALASSCDEHRHELWESGGVAGCERARVAERQRDALLEALKEVLAWGTDQNYVRAEAACDKARAAIKAVEGEKT